jgi:hypothetical protein
MLLRVLDSGVNFSTYKPQDSEAWQSEPNGTVRGAREGGLG